MRGGGLLGKLLGGISTAVGGNIGGILGNKITQGVQGATIPLGSTGKGLNIATEGAAVVAGTVAGYMRRGLLDDFVSGLAGGMAAQADPTLSTTFVNPATVGAAVAGGARGSDLTV